MSTIAASSLGAAAARADQLATPCVLHGVRALPGNAGLRQLSLAYLLHSAAYFVFVFWYFRYLTAGRGFTILSSGVWGGLPGISGVVGSPLIGACAHPLGRCIGTARARRRVAMGCLLSAGRFVIVRAVVPGALLAIVALSPSPGCVDGADAPFS